MFHAGSEVCLSSVFSFSLCKQIIPQFVCSRYGLAIGAAVAPFVRVLVFICYPVAYPISKVTYAENIMCLCHFCPRYSLPSPHPCTLQYSDGHSWRTLDLFLVMISDSG
jgi:hypothetical protein